MKRDKKPTEFNKNAKGYAYLSDDNIQMVEFRIDDHNFLHNIANEMGYGLMGGNVSVRKLESELRPQWFLGMIRVSWISLFCNRQWVGPEGQRALLPKKDSLNLMSAFQSRKTGFGLKLSRVQLDEINESSRGKNHVDMDTAIAIHGQATKKDLKNSPFVIFFEHGANKKGYWTYNYMSIQFWDRIDCLKVVFPHFDFSFLFTILKSVPNAL